MGIIKFFVPRINKMFLGINAFILCQLCISYCYVVITAHLLLILTTMVHRSLMYVY